MLSIGLSAIVFTLGVISVQLSMLIKTGWIGSFFSGLLLLGCLIVAFFLAMNGILGPSAMPLVAR